MKSPKFKVGDRIVFISTHPEEGDYGTIMRFDEDGDPCVQWDTYRENTPLAVELEYIRKLTKLEKALK